jgi:hypothetical protein
VTRFLRVGFIQERLVEIAEAAEYAQALLELDEPARRRLQERLAKRGVRAEFEEEIRRSLRQIGRLSRDTARFLADLPCQPLLYTGPEDTEVVIRRLEQLVGDQPLGEPSPPRRGRQSACG